MQQSASTSSVQPNHDGGQLIPRLVRHITSIQISNLTPFPVRDAFTSAFSLPTEQSQPSEVNDDLGTILSKRRTRKPSSASAMTRRSLKWDDSALDAEASTRDGVRSRTTSQTKAPSSSPSRPGQPLSYSSRSYRARANSMASTHSNTRSISSLVPVSSTSNGFNVHSFLPDHTQLSLERVIESRLVETFITISLSPTEYPQPSPSGSRSPEPQTPTAPRTPTFNQKKSTTLPKDVAKSSPTQSTTRKATQPNRVNGISKKTVSPANAKAPSEISIRAAPSVDTPAVPTYFSQIHRPSTNPTFAVDLRTSGSTEHSFDSASRRLKVAAWGKLNRRTAGPDGTTERWSLLYEWDIDLDRLLPLPDDVDGQPSLLPSNTIVITLSPPLKRFYLPPHAPLAVRPHSPCENYASDPESNSQRERRAEKHAQLGLTPDNQLSSRRRRAAESSSDVRMAKTATLQDLFKLVNYQALLTDNETYLHEVVDKIDDFLKDDELSPLRREISVRQCRVTDLAKARSDVLEQAAQVRAEIAARTESLKSRNRLLEEARNCILWEADEGTFRELEKARSSLSDIQQRTVDMRGSLISTLSSIFPIELLSPPDLLFTIVDVPLPIPLSPNDPAPPLSMSQFKDVNEDSVATALGYAAQVVNVLAAYMGKSLMYPVTCIGSRSLIRDGISAMVGPRMFPLFSKGVDTYRFEYGVFLLNKNIEILMSERDLRALDMRHTLPNLKNLLLTLGHDAVFNFEVVRRPASPLVSDSGLETPSRSGSPVGSDVNTPKANSVHSRELSAEGTTPTGSGRTTPTGRDETRRSKAFLGFVALPEFLRTRYSTGTADDDEQTLHGEGTP